MPNITNYIYMFLQRISAFLDECRFKQISEATFHAISCLSFSIDLNGDLKFQDVVRLG